MKYQSGFGSHFESEALPNALPTGQNSPQTCPYGLYAEQLSGTAFTVPRTHNQRSWLYRIKPSIGHQPFIPEDSNLESDFTRLHHTPNQLRWSPFEPIAATDFAHGLYTVCGAGDPASKSGLAIHVYLVSKDMESSSFYSADGDMLLVPQQGALSIQTEFGFLEISPYEICVIPRGIKFAIKREDDKTLARGYILEVFNGHFELPDLGPIGANGLANPRDFLYPVAAHNLPKEETHYIYCKYLGKLFKAEQQHSAFNVVAWHGNYAPYKYDLRKFNTINTVSFDHVDPSVFTVLTCKSALPGVAIADFVIFPSYWTVSEHTFRPPYYHRNIMSEFMGNICGIYEAKKEGFLPGGASLHSCMSAHGPDRTSFEVASSIDLKPVKLPSDTMSFMFESSLAFGISDWAMDKCGKLQSDYWKVWTNMDVHFDPAKRDLTRLK